MITIEDRICEVCGQPVHAGMTNQDGDFYAHKGECFEQYMDKTYGKHKWMRVNDDCQGGYYIAADDTVAGGHFGTGIYYTEWEDECEDVGFPLECVETCPHCEGENIYPNYDPIANGYKAICKHCGEEIFLCDECIHATDNKEHRCDWNETETGGRCFRGVTVLTQFKTDDPIRAIENLGWTVLEESDGYYLSRQSNAGEDFGFSVSKENWIQDIVDYYKDFNPDEHATTIWLYTKRDGSRAIPGIGALLQDAVEICENLEDLAILASKFKEES